MRPGEDETALEFVERADAANVDEALINAALIEHFGIQNDGDRKKLKLRSAPFWERVFRTHIAGIYQRGGSRYAAVTYIRRKNDRNEVPRFSEAELDKIVDSVGDWEARPKTRNQEFR